MVSKKELINKYNDFLGNLRQIIATAGEFLDSPIVSESWYSTILIMNCAIHLEGKKQCVHVEDDKIISVMKQIYKFQIETNWPT